MEKKNYKERQVEIQKGIFDSKLLGGEFMGKERPFVLKDSKGNFVDGVEYEMVMEYFAKNDINWWRGDKPTGHTLSSQIACLNHLFPLREDETAVLALAQQIDPTLDGVELLKNDKDGTQGYISFEVVSDTDHLNEKNGKNKQLTRGSQCTSIDAVILARRGNKRVLLVIEWKYVEQYGNEDKSKNPDGKTSGDTRLNRYCRDVFAEKNLIQRSEQLEDKDEYRGSVYFAEPFYQLMRQTLWAEQMIRHSATETIKADDYIHIHVVPSGNKALLDKIYPCSGKGMEETWRSVIKDQDKYKIIDPKDLFSSIDSKKYEKLIDYLSNRYWKE